MQTVDNIENIKDFIRDDYGEDRFFFAQIIQRKKDNPQIGSNNRIIKTYYIHSEEYLDSKVDEIKKLCQMFNARAMIHLTPRSYEKVALQAMKIGFDKFSSGEHASFNKVYNSACGRTTHPDKSLKTWVLDIDNLEYAQMCDVVDSLRGIATYLVCFPTVNGFHIIIKPCDMREFKCEHEWSLHKNNPTMLYACCKSLGNENQMLGRKGDRNEEN